MLPAGLRLPRLRTLWCGCSLQLGARVVGYLHLMGLFGGLFSLLVVESGRKVKEEWLPDTTSHDPTKFYLFFRDSMVLVSAITILLTSAALLFGIRKGLTDFMEPFLLTKATVLFVDFFDFCLSILLRAMKHKDIYIFYQMLFLGVEGLMLLIVYSYYMDLLEKVTQPESEPT